MLEFCAETFRLPWGREMLNLRSSKVQVLFCRLADVYDPLLANFMEPFRFGMLKLSVGVKYVRVWACVLG